MTIETTLTEPYTENRSITSSVRLFRDTMDYLQKQGLEDASGHPDPAIRAFNRGFYSQLETNPRIAEILRYTCLRRPDLTPDHLTNLIARASQYLLRKQQNTEYPHYSDQHFSRWLESLSPEYLAEFNYLLETKSTSTHVPERYRSLAALASIIGPTSILDIGSSGGLGLPAAASPRFLLRESGNGRSLIDSTPGEIVRAGLTHDQVFFKTAVNLDLEPIDWEWLYACSYFSQYDTSKRQLEEDRHQLSSRMTEVVQKYGDICSPSIPSALGRESFDIVHASMVTYQMNPEKRAMALGNAEACLKEGGLLTELTFEDTSNWFKDWNVITTVRVKQHGQLQPPLTWLRWDKSRCKEVQAGADFDQVNTLLHNKAHIA